MYWWKRTVSSYKWSHRGEISHSGLYDIQGAQDEHAKDSSEFFKGFISINSLCLIRYPVIALSVRLGIPNILTTLLSPRPPHTHIRDKDRFQRFLPSATFFWKVPRRGAEKRVLSHFRGFPGNSVVKNLPANAGAMGSIPGSGRSPEEGNGDPLQYFCLENPSIPAVFLPRRLAGYSPQSRRESDTT